MEHKLSPMVVNFIIRVIFGQGSGEPVRHTESA